jgi:hypothetical protein
VRNPDRPQVLHGVTQHSRLDVLVALELDPAHLDLGTFLDHKCDPDRGRRNLPYFRSNRCKLPAMLGQQAFDGHFGLFYFGGVILTFHRQSDLRLFEAVEDIAAGNRTVAGVIDLADRRLFLHLDNQPPTLRSLFPAKPDILEITRIPQRVEIALQRGGIVNVARVGEDARLNRLGWNSAVSLDVDLGNDVGLGPA